MTKVLDLTDRLKKRIEYADAEDVLDALLDLNENSVMIVFNTGGKLQFSIQTAIRFKVDCAKT
jgi:hypothetical protein